MRILIVLAFLFGTTSLMSQTVHHLNLGGTDVNVVIHDSGKPGPLYFNMHDNESTSVDAASKIARRKGGKLAELVHSGGRNIEFMYDTLHYAIDPNRIYTDTGVWRELERTAIRDTVVFNMVQAFGDTLIKLLDIDKQEVVIALHNNSDCRYCLYSYTEGGDYENDAAATYRGKWEDPDEFYFVTTAEDFTNLQSSGYNIVLQNNAAVTDDGSLSVYCGFHGIQYINVEAQHGNVKPQRRMIRKLLKSFR